ncbi:MAG: protein kinase [Deltaproteobacteria bacterium]|nr:protein kinase [Deltaproteobacteria bacterium]
MSLFPAGERIGGRFELKEMIGVGTTSVVYRAVDRAARQVQVAVKILNPGLDEATRQRLVSGTRTLVSHRHRNVVMILDAGIHDGQVYIASEYLDRTLSEGLEGASLQERFRLFHGVADGVRFLHGRGLVHRDVHMRNILLQVQPGGELRPKVNDVGMGAWLGFEGTGQIRPEFLFHMPPEQVEDPSPETSHDIYALGVFLYELLVGAPPITSTEVIASLRQRLERGETLPFAFRSVLTEIPPRPIPPDPRLHDLSDLQRIVGRAMRPRPSERYPSVESLQRDVRRYQEGRPLVGVPETRSRRLWKLVRRNRQRVIQGGLAAAALAVGLWGLAWQRLQPGVVVPVLQEEVPGLRVTLDGRTIPIDALAQERLGPGVVSLSLEAPGYVGEERLVRVPAGERVEMQADLLRQQGELSLISYPPGAVVTLLGPDNRSLPPMVAPFVYRAPTGDWTAVVESPDYDRTQLRFEVQAEEPTVVQARLRKLLVARREVGGQPRLTRLPGNPARLGVASLEEGEPWLETFDPRTGDRLGRVRLGATMTSGTAWMDADRDGLADLIYGDSIPSLVIRSGRDLGVVLARLNTTLPVVGRPLVIPGAPTGRVLVGLADGTVSAFDLWGEGGAQRGWSIASRAPGFDPALVDHGPISYVGDTALFRAADGSLFGASAVDGHVQWEMPGVHRPAAAVVGGAGGVERIASTDTEGSFVLVEPQAGKVIRSGLNESSELKGLIPVWEEDGVWRRARVMENGRIWLEDLETGDLAVEIGVFPGVERVWSASEGQGRRVLLLQGSGMLRGIRIARGEAELIFSRPVEELSADPVFFWQREQLGAAWVEESSLVIWSL